MSDQRKLSNNPLLRGIVKLYDQIRDDNDGNTEPQQPQQARNQIKKTYSNVLISNINRVREQSGCSKINLEDEKSIRNFANISAMIMVVIYIVTILLSFNESLIQNIDKTIQPCEKKSKNKDRIIQDDVD